MISLITTEQVEPSVVTYNIYLGSKIVSNGTITDFTLSSIPQGFLITFEPDLTRPTASGNYLIVYQYGKATYTEPYVIDENVDVLDTFTISNYVTITNPYVDSVLTLYKGNDVVLTDNVTGSKQIDLSLIEPSVNPLYCVIQSNDHYLDFRVWKINPSIMTVMKDLRTFLDRLNSELRLDTLRFSDTDYLLWMEAGMNRWNGLPYGTTFTMTNATGAIRDMWMLCSQIQALRTRYLEEGLSSFNYSGASVQLDFDVTPHIESVIQALETRLADEGSKIKMQLYNTNQLSGPGLWRGQNKALGTTGISLGPVTNNRLF